MTTIAEDLGISMEGLTTPEEPEALQDPQEIDQADQGPVVNTPEPTRPSILEELDLPPISGEEPRTSVPVSEMPEDIQEDIAHQDEQNKRLAESVFSAEEIEAIKAKGPIGFLEARKFLDWEDVVPLGGLKQAEELINLKQATDKLKRGEEPTEYEANLMNQFLRETVEKNLRGYSIRGSIANVGAQVPAFATELLLTGGIGKLAHKATQEAVGKVVKNRAISTVAGASANVLARSAALPAAYVPTYAERRLNDAMAITDKGELIAEESEESPAMSAFKAYGFTAIEVGAELSGAATSKYVVQPLAGKLGSYLRTPVSSGVMKLPAKLRNNLYEAYRAIQPNAKVTEVFSNLGWNGMISELGEERVSQILGTTFDVATGEEMTMEDYLDRITPSKDDLLVEAGVISLFGGVKGATNAVVNILQNNEGLDKQTAEEIVDNMSETEKDNYINENMSVRSQDETPDVSPAGYSTPEYIGESDINNDESVFQSAYRDWVDDLDALQQVSDISQAQDTDVDTVNSPVNLARISRGVMSTIEHQIKYNTTRYNKETGTFEYSGKSLRQIMDDFDAIASTVEPSRDTRREDSALFGVSLSILDDVELQKTNDNINISPEQEAQARQDIADLEAKYGDEIEFIRTNNREKTEYAQRIAENLVESGLISQEKFDTMVAERPNYLPLERVMEDIDGYPKQSKSFSDIDSTLRIRRGSEREIVDINKTLIKNTARVLDAAARNRVGVALADLADIIPDRVQRAKVPMKKITVKDHETGKSIETFRPTGDAPKGAITVYRDGKPEYYTVSEPLLKTMEGLNQVQLNYLDKTAAFLTGLVKAGSTTYNPDFFVMNPTRDVVGAMITSQGRVKPFDVVKAVGDIIFKTQNFKDAKAQGMNFDSLMNMDEQGFDNSLKELMGQPPSILDIQRLPVFKQINDLNNIAETAPRLAAYKKIREEGHSGIEAAIYGRDLTLDFSRKGFKGRKANLYWAFLNAGIQGTDKLARTIRDYPVETAIWGTATVTAPSMALTAFYILGADEETRERYLETPQWERDLFWLVPKEDGSFTRVPKPFSFGYMFGSLPERMVWEMWQNEGSRDSTIELLKELSVGFAGSVSPITLNAGSVWPSAVKPVIETWMNENFFRGTPVYPQWLEDDDMADFVKTNSSTSQSLQDLSSFLYYNTGLDFSPAVMQHLIEGYTSSLGRNAINLTDKLYREGRKAAGEEVAEVPLDIKNYPVLRAFSTREPVGSSSKSVQDFYENFSELRGIHKTYRRELNDKGREAASKYKEKHVQELRIYNAVNSRYMKRMKRLNDQMTDMWQDTTMTPLEKAERRSEIGGAATELAKQANEYINDNKEK